MNIPSIWKLITVEKPWITMLIIISALGIYLLISRIIRNRPKKIKTIKRTEERTNKMTEETPIKVPSPPPQFRRIDDEPSFALEAEVPKGKAMVSESRSAIEEFKEKANKLHRDVAVTTDGLRKELGDIKSFKKEIESMVDVLRIYYRDLTKKERILGLTLEGLASGPEIEQTPQQKKLL